jgi:phenylacetate-CoA ligase
MVQTQTGAAALRELVAHAYASAPAITELFDGAGVRPEDIREADDLARLPVTTKERLLELQRERPPFGGFLAVPVADLRHVFISPGPIYDAQSHDHHGYGFESVFGAIGVGPDDVVLNTWSYHLVPAGLVMDEALTALGATVIPAGVGNTEQQAHAIIDLGVTVIAASTGFFIALTDKLGELDFDLPADWRVRAALLGGEFGDWMGKRRRLEQRFGIRTTSAYATAELGVVGYECERAHGYHVAPDMIVQICDVSGAPLPPGESGEIVVTPMNRAFPILRFGTGDASFLESDPCPCGDPAPVLAPLLGRVAQSVKVREIFVYPRHVEDVGIRAPGIGYAQAVVTRPGSREEVRLLVEPAPGVDRGALEEHARDAFTTVSRLRLDELVFVPADSIPRDEPLVLDRKDA